MDTADTVLAKGLTNRLIHSLRMQEGRGRVKRDGKRKGVTVWQLPVSAPLSCIGRGAA
jgi:hypothetical protein